MKKTTFISLAFALAFVSGATTAHSQMGSGYGMGPYMMWNAKYGHMGMMGGYSYNAEAKMPISEKQAINLAQDYIKTSFPRASVDKDVETFYGFYEVGIKMNGKPFSHLFINGYTGQYWYFNPHGQIFQIKKFS